MVNIPTLLKLVFEFGVMQLRTHRALTTLSLVLVSGLFHAGVAFALGMVPQLPRRTLDPDGTLSFIEMPPLVQPAELVEPPPNEEAPPPPDPKVARKSRPVPARATAEPEGSPDAERAVDEASDEVAELTVASQDGGLAVAGRAGDGRAGAVSGARVASAPIGEAPPVDLRALKRAYAPALHRALMPTIEPLALILKRRRQSIEGETVVGLEIDGAGAFTRVWLRTSCGESSMDEAAIAEVKRVGRATPPPAPLAGETFAVPYKWKLLAR
jgi:periplasmic protein TonB